PTPELAWWAYVPLLVALLARAGDIGVAVALIGVERLVALVIARLRAVTLHRGGPGLPGGPRGLLLARAQARAGRGPPGAGGGCGRWHLGPDPQVAAQLLGGRARHRDEGASRPPLRRPGPLPRPRRRGRALGSGRGRALGLTSRGPVRCWRARSRALRSSAAPRTPRRGTRK